MWGKRGDKERDEECMVDQDLSDSYWGDRSGIKPLGYISVRSRDGADLDEVLWWW